MAPAQAPAQAPAPAQAAGPVQAAAPAPVNIPVINLSLNLAGAGLSNLTTQNAVSVKDALADQLHICESACSVVALKILAMRFDDSPPCIALMSSLSHDFIIEVLADQLHFCKPSCNLIGT